MTSAADTPLLPQQRPLLVVLSGPSGVGKDVALIQLKTSGAPYYFTVTATTRPKRPAEREGVDYIFLSSEQFRDLVDRHELLEWAQVYGNFYGVPTSQVREALARGQDTIVKVDVQGAATIKKLAPDAVFIFLAPPDLATLEQRLRLRMTEDGHNLAVRLKTAEAEMAQLPLFDYVVVNRDGQLEAAVHEIQAIIQAEKCRVRPRTISL